MQAAETTLRNTFKKQLGLPIHATNFLCDMFQVIQFFDDVADGDKMQRSDLDRALWTVLVGNARNQFYIENIEALTALISTQILKWQASDVVERSGDVSETSFVWRAGYYDLVLFVVEKVHGWQEAQKASEFVMKLYGETFADYKEEFKNA